jgi:two-component system nitrate/nitrite response regulator NarL
MAVTHRIYVVDDHPLMRRGYRSLLESQPDLRVCGEAGSVKEALAEVKELEPDLVIADIALGESNGLDLVRPHQRGD